MNVKIIIFKRVYCIFNIEGWLEFLIDFIVRNWSIVMIFVIDVIDKEIF